MANILFFDTKTSGFPRNYKAPASELNNWPRLIQLAFVKYDENKELLYSWDKFIETNEFNISQNSENIQSITNKKVENEGISIEVVLKKFLKEIKNADLIVGHNVDFDIKVVQSEFIRSDIEPNIIEIMSSIPVVCTMKASTEFCSIPETNGFKWPTLTELHLKLFGEYFDNKHNLLCDVTATANCFWELVSFGVLSLNEQLASKKNVKIINTFEDIKKYEILLRDRFMEDTSDPFKIYTKNLNQNSLIQYVRLVGNFNKNFKELKEIIRQNPNFSEAYFQYARNISTLSWNSSIQILNELIEYDPDNVKALTYRAMINFKYNIISSKEDILKVISINPSNSYAKYIFNIIKGAEDLINKKSDISKKLEIDSWNNLSPKWQKLIITNNNICSKKITDIEHILGGEKTTNDSLPIIINKANNLKEFYISFFDNNYIDWLKRNVPLTDVEFKDILDESISTLDPLILLTQIELFYSCGNNFDLSILSQLPNLRTLILPNNKSGIMPLGYLENLIELDLSYYQKRDINLSPISNLKKLKKLNLENIFSDISVITSLTQLTELNINGYINRYVKSEHLRNLFNLKKLCIDSCADVSFPSYESLNFLEVIPNLEFLSINNNHKELTFISKMLKLKELHLDNNTENLEPLSDLSNLEKLHLRSNKNDLKAISKLENLKFLDLEYNSADITPIKWLIEHIRRMGGIVHGVD